MNAECGMRNVESGRPCRGVTLLEMLVVLTLMGLLAAVVGPSVGAGLETVRLRSSAERLAASFKVARERAVRTRHYVEVTLSPSAHRVAIRDLEGDFERGWDLDQTIAVKEQSSWPLEAEAQPESAIAFVFPPDGTTPAVALRLENRHGRAVDVEMDPLTAFPTVIDPAKEPQP